MFLSKNVRLHSVDCCNTWTFFYFPPGDKIVTVNGKSLSGLTYRESTDFIRQCPGPNVKMGIIKHALYKKEGRVLSVRKVCARLFPNELDQLS